VNLTNGNFDFKRIYARLYATIQVKQDTFPMTSRRLLYPAADSGNSPEKFEDLLGRLEQIVSDMENAELPLEKLLANYEEGMRLVKTCGDRLTDAEQKVEILSRSISADLAKVPVPPEETPPVAPKDEIRLF
jgi:exodeoxyribonuclease VII small subunit